jgi:hypothetical protein
MEGFLDDVAAYDDEELAEAEDDAASRSGRIQAELTDTTEQEIALLKRMERWAARYETMPDAKAKELITYLQGVCRPDGTHWTNERVVVFTEYRDTQIWLKELLASEGLSGERVRLLYGGMDTRQREQLRLAFAEPPGQDQNQVRILSPPMPPARASTCTSTATGWSTTTSRSTRTSLSSGSAVSTGTASRRFRRSGTSSGRAGRRAAIPTRPTWSSWPGSRPR